MISRPTARHAALGAALLIALSPAWPAPAATLPPEVIPDTCGVQLKGYNDDAANLDRIAALGLKFVRRGFIWESIEKTRGVYDFSAYDRFVKDCQAHHLGVLACMAFGNRLYGKVTTPEGRAAYARFAAALAAHYQGDDLYFEIWNEPNVHTFWGSQSTGTHNSEQYADEYTALVKATVPAMKQADPKCFVMAGSVSGLWSASFAWQKFCFAKGILKTGIDAWSVHPYSTKSPEDAADGYAQVRDMMAAAGTSRDFPILNSERGYPLGKAEGFAGGDLVKSKEYQAWHVVRQYLVDLMSGVRMTNWYQWSGKEGFALHDAATPPPAETACRVMIAQLRGYRLDQRLKTRRDRDYVLRFINDHTGCIKLVAWSAPPQSKSPDAAPTHAITVPVEATGTLATCDLYGQAGQKAVHEGTVALTLTGAPQYVTLRPGH